MTTLSEAVVTGSSWNCQDPATCCSNGSQGFSYEFCMALCVLCCCELTITFEYPPRVGIGGGKPPSLTNPRDYPTFTPQNGIAFTVSSYGTVLPIVYGSDKLTGNVFWATPVGVHNTEIAGQPFLYQTVSFALGICEGEINGVLRIWLGDKLIIDNSMTVDGSDVAVAGDDGFIAGFTVDLTDPASPLAALPATARQTTISVFTGSEFQQAETAMVAQEGYEGTPGYRGTAYVLFENFVIDSSTLPAIFVEVTSHTTSQFPRLYGDFTDTVFDTWKYFMLQYDPSFDRFYAVGNKASPAHNGIVVIDGNTLEELDQFEIDTRYTIAPRYELTTILPLTGFLVNNQAFGNTGTTYVFNPSTGDRMSQIGPGGGISSHSLTLGFSPLSPSAVVGFVGIGTTGVPIDIFCGVGTTNQSVGFAQIDETGVISMASTLNSVTPNNNNTISVVAIPDGQPALSDGAASSGIHIYGFSAANTEKLAIRPWRVSVNSDLATLSAPVYTALAEISVGQLGGTGFQYVVRQAMTDTSDNCIVLIITSNSRGTFMVKYSPFTGELLWVTPISDLPSSVQSISGPDWGMLPGGTYAWIDGASSVWEVVLATGAVTNVLDSLSNQSLPLISNAHQYYNGYENSITYLTGTTAKHITKFYLHRITRSTVDLSDIALDLIGRTGLQATDIDVDEVTALTLNGYTIRTIKSIRDAFGELAQAFTYDVVESNGKIKYKTRGGATDATIPHGDLMKNEDNNAWLNISQMNDGSRVRKLNLTYRDIDREYDQNVQSVILTKYGTQVFDPESAIDVNVPIVLTSDEAKRLAEILLYAKLTYNTTYTFTMAPSHINLDPADVITITMPVDEDDVTVRLRNVSIGEDNSVEVEASEENSDIYNDQVDLFSSIGRFEKSVFPSVPRRVDPYILQIAGRSSDEINETNTSYKMFVAFLNSRPGITLSDAITAVVDGGTRVTIPAPDSFPTWGYVVTPPTYTKSGMSTDYASTLVVQLVGTDGAAIASAIGGKADLLASDQVNLCYVGGELLQFVTATSLGGNKYQLTELHRCKLGSDFFLNSATAGSRFILLAGNDGVLDTVGVVSADIEIGTSPRKVIQFFMNTGNPFLPPFITQYTALNLRPWLVADKQMKYVSTDAVITWERRSRIGGEWPDDGTSGVAEAVPQPELSDTYEMYIFKDFTTFKPSISSTYMRKVTGIAPPATNATGTFTYTAAMQTADGFVRTTDTLYVLLYQAGSLTGNDNGAGEIGALPHI